MEPRLPRAYAIELLGTFALVLISAGVVCVNQATTPEGARAGLAPLTLHQPGLFGLALAQGLIFGAMLAVTVPYSGGYLNPALTLMLWCFGRMDTVRAAWLIGAQLVGAVLAASCLRLTFAVRILEAAQYGAPHINPLAYQTLDQGSVAAGVGIELLLTFFLVFAIFGVLGAELDARQAALAGGAVLAAGVLFAFPLTGAALNPARWFGPVFLEALGGGHGGKSPWADALVYLAGPIVGALLGGGVCFKLLHPPR
jgi:aquaporin TIP